MGFLPEVGRTIVFFAVFIGIAVALKLIEPVKMAAMIRGPQRASGASDA
jgi:hypothetical protein